MSGGSANARRLEPPRAPVSEPSREEPLAVPEVASSDPREVASAGRSCLAILILGMLLLLVLCLGLTGRWLLAS